MYRVILASNSPRRKDILENLGIKFSVVTSEVEEKIDCSVDPYNLTCDLAYAKAKNVSERIEGKAIIIGADTVVLHQKILGKPRNHQEAYEILKSLSGKAHEVVTGIAVIDNDRKKQVTEYEVTKVYFREISDEEILKYIQTGEPMDKAGAYGIQGKASLFVKKIEGDYYNVVGLPIFRLGKIMHRYFNMNFL
ncbi:nucleoside triphosphate pyrophosphatase [Clostridium formicaceticum]|uniref:dTTP/UTP pyrophosphatase n=1 Tax=Clostridium formicaceticum TaxID=1497 RepID=A0AAC9WFV7_9CLOT|nr:Maf family protein [Clostridium formicaceticum]AOY76849.1 septum formation protein Maf [Clostridium formicaceticum]ARE87327.1 Septum formation protein Maf [Clostridium formicaceticum]